MGFLWVNIGGSNTDNYTWSSKHTLLVAIGDQRTI